MKKFGIFGLAYVAVAIALLLHYGETPSGGPPDQSVGSTGKVDVVETGRTWFQRAKPFCNPVEVEAHHRVHPPPFDLEARGFSAACYALAGRIEEARNIIEALGSEDQWRAAGIVFDVAHPVADAGDDLAAGPIMGLVVEFWPNHYMALYHAGAANFELGNEQVATDYLTRFLRHYPERDGWTARARDLLGAIDPHLVSLSR